MCVPAITRLTPQLVRNSVESWSADYIRFHRTTKNPTSANKMPLVDVESWYQEKNQWKTVKICFYAKILKLKLILQ